MHKLPKNILILDGVYVKKTQTLIGLRLLKMCETDVFWPMRIYKNRRIQVVTFDFYK